MNRHKQIPANQNKVGNIKNNEPIDPYRPPSTNSQVLQQTNQVGVAIKDIRPLGWLAIVAIAVQVVINFAMLGIHNMPAYIEILLVTHFVTGLLAIVCFLVWYFRAALNMCKLHPHAPIRPIWGVCCYFVPFANLICPYLEMRNLTRWTFAGRPQKALEVVAVIWWFTLLIRLFVNRAPFGGEARLVWIIATLVSAVCVAILIIRISGKQAAFRQPETPTTEKVEMHPISQSGGLPPRKSRPIPGSEIEDSWGTNKSARYSTDKNM